jgi:hypothetical protein
MRKLFLINVLALVIEIASPAYAGEVDVERYGFWMGILSGRYTHNQDAGPSDDFLLWEERYRTDLTFWPEDIDAMGRLKIDAIHDGVDNDFRVEVREGYIDYYTDAYDFRIGRQVATWGVGDLIFINDWFPKNWESFFAGRPLEYLKTGVDGVRARYSSSDYSWEIYLVPFFTPDQLPSSDRFYFFDPLSTVPTRVEDKPDFDLSNTEIGFRLYGRIEDFDVALYHYRGFWRNPGFKLDDPAMPSMVTMYYPELSTYGFSAQGSAYEGIVSFEAGYYHSRSDSAGTNPFIPNSQLRFLVGYDRDLDSDTHLGLQYYIELMQDHGAYVANLPDGFPSQGQYRDTFTIRLDKWYQYRTLNLALFAFFSPKDDDYLVQPSITYKFEDNLTGVIGANIFGGESGTSFLGQFDKNDNLFVSFRYDF